MTDEIQDVRCDLDRLADLVGTEDQPAIEELRRRLTGRRLRVLVVGEAKRGKSTLINALLGRSVLPSGVVPLTAVPTTVIAGDVEQVEVRFQDGTGRLHLALTDVEEFVSQQHNPDNHKGVTDVIVALRAPLLDNVELVDVPGTGSVHGRNTAEADTALGRMDAAIVVLTADPPISEVERQLIRDVRAASVRSFFVLNKVDRLDERDSAEALEFTQRVLEDLVGEPATVWPVSALHALRAAESGGSDHRTAGECFEEFAAAFESYLAESSDADLVRSVAVRSRRLAESVIDRGRSTLAALDLSAGNVNDALRDFERRLRVVEQERRVTAGIADTGFRAMLDDTNSSAQQVIEANQNPLGDEVSRRLAPGSRPDRDRESSALSYAADRIEVIVNQWRTDWQAHLERAVTALDEQLNSRLNDHIAAVRNAAADLFGVQLATYDVHTRLRRDRAFNYRFDPLPGQYDAMAAVLRRRLPHRIVRRYVENYVVARTRQLLDKQVGRARSDFQVQLQEARRTLVGDLRGRYEEGGGGIIRALEAGTEHRNQDQRESERTRRELVFAVTAAGAIIEDLRRIVPDLDVASPSQ